MLVLILASVNVYVETKQEQEYEFNNFIPLKDKHETKWNVNFIREVATDYKMLEMSHIVQAGWLVLNKWMVLNLSQSNILWNQQP